MFLHAIKNLFDYLKHIKSFKPIKGNNSTLLFHPNCYLPEILIVPNWRFCLFPPSFSILGMNLFGCKFCEKSEDSNSDCDRKNFDSLLWAIVTVFQVLLLNWTFSVLCLELYSQDETFAISLSQILTVNFLGVRSASGCYSHSAKAKPVYFGQI